MSPVGYVHLNAQYGYPRTIALYGPGSHGPDQIEPPGSPGGSTGSFIRSS